MKRITAFVLALAFIVPATALAQGGSTCQAYNPQLCAVASKTANKTATAATSSGTLPFTGLDVGLLVAGGGLLLGGGLLVRRLSSDQG